MQCVVQFLLRKKLITTHSHSDQGGPLHDKAAGKSQEEVERLVNIASVIALRSQNND